MRVNAALARGAAVTEVFRSNICMGPRIAKRPRTWLSVACYFLSEGCSAGGRGLPEEGWKWRRKFLNLKKEPGGNTAGFMKSGCLLGRRFKDRHRAVEPLH